jgi:hypothetical protein
VLVVLELRIQAVVVVDRVFQILHPELVVLAVLAS